jgi:tetratricopeptide (TPR) repeat protein
MGVVYKAWDQTLGVVVALKVIRPRVLADAEVARGLERRFKRELLLAREVTHKSVVRIHDLGEIDGIKYITMSYVTGSDLRTILRSEGKLPVPRALRIARQLASGLKAAHDAGVVHRDLKPANIMIDAENDPLIMDFGIARSTRGEGGTTSRGDGPPVEGNPPPEWVGGLTVPGAIVGTLDYMAPEQARGEEVDQRADLYAFGLILYDMLVGPGRHHEITRGAIMESDPTEVPDALRRIIGRCLEPDPESRYASASELEGELAGLDEKGHRLPWVWRFSLAQMTLAGFLAVAAVVGAFWLARPPPPPPDLAPLSLLVADFENETGDPVFDGSLEQALAVGMESASFVTSYPRHEAMRVASEIAPDRALDEATARLVSMREDIDVVLSGTIRADGQGYSIALRAVDPALEEPILETEASASTRDEVLEAVSSLAARVRKALGDTAAEGQDEAGRETFTAASLEAARTYSLAQDLAMSYRDAEAIEHYRQATVQDPSFGRAYAGWAYSAFRLGRTEESEAAWEKALSLLDRMTEREKYRTLGLYYGTISRNYEKAIESYETLLRLYPADDAGHNNLAMSYFGTRDFDKALEEGRRALQIYPSRLMYRVNCSLFAMYASDFATAESEASRILEDHPDFYDAYLPIAIAAIARSDYAAARDAYQRLSASGRPGSSLAALGLADLAIYQGHYPEAVDILLESIAEEESAESPAFLNAKFVALADAYQGSGERKLALAAIESALAAGGREEVVVPSVRILVQQGAHARARELARGMESQLETESRAYARILEGEVALGERSLIDALDAFQAARELADPWLARFDLGVLFVEAGRYAEALPELELCEKRKGEASAIFLDDIPTYRYLAPLPYWLGRAREGLGMRDVAAHSYESYLALRGDTGDPLAVDARRRREGLID